MARKAPVRDVAAGLRPARRQRACLEAVGG